MDYYNKTDIFWGYCPPNCNGELPHPSSPYNLTKSEHLGLWTSHFYDLRSWENGFCHTYNPEEKSEIDFLGRVYFMMANTSAKYQDYDIYIYNSTM